MEKSKWWGYKTKLGSFEAFEYKTSNQIMEAYRNTFYELIVGPFEAQNKLEAIEIIKMASDKKYSNTI